MAIGLLTKMFIENIVWWSQSGSEDGFGKAVFSSPVEIEGRWVKKRELFRSVNGKEEVSNAIVRTDRYIAVGDYLYRGDLDSVSNVSDPRTLAGAYEVRDAQDVPTFRGTQDYRKAIL